MANMLKIFYFFLIFVVIRFCNINGRITTSVVKDIGDIVAIAGEKTEIPCPSAPRKPGDKPNLILWYKDSLHKPIYSYDARHGDFSRGVRWANKTLLGDRAFFIPASKPFSTLVIEPVIATDEGHYSCRLDYVDSPTTSSSSNLTVIIHPSPPEVYWNNQQVVGPIGPLKEGTTSKLTCITSGGRPSPTLTWWMEGSRIIADSVTTEGKVRSSLTIKATREINMKTYSCHTQSLHKGVAVAEPLVATVMFDIILSPIAIRIEGGELPTVSDSTVTLKCTAWGSNPPASIQWWSLGKRLKSFSNSISDGGNSSVAEIKINVRPFNHGVTYICKATNPSHYQRPLEDRVMLNVTYKPMVELRVKTASESMSQGSTDTHLIVKDGSHIQMECPYQANPSPEYIEWLHNGVIVESGPNALSLLLHRVTKNDSGTYSCAATNSNGQGMSRPYVITVEYAPECTVGWKKRTQGTEIGRSVTVLCRVNALPFNDLSFYWSSTNRKGIETEFLSSQIQTDGVTSRLTFTPRNVSDFGTLNCKAKNIVGLQSQACHVNLVPASAPDPPFNCTSEPGTLEGSILVSCVEGFDGGFPQEFSLIAIQKSKVIANIARNFPEWVIKNLETGKSVTLRIEASNARGKSNMVRLEAYVPSIQYLADQGVSGASSHGDRRTPLPVIGILVGIGGALGIAAFGFLIYFIATDKCDAPDSEMYPRTLKSSSSAINNSKNKLDTIPLRRHKASDPDIVSCIRPDSARSSFKNLDIVSRSQPIMNSTETVEAYRDASSSSCSSMDQDDCLFDRSQRPFSSSKSLSSTREKRKMYAENQQLPDRISQRPLANAYEDAIHNNYAPCRMYSDREVANQQCQVKNCSFDTYPVDRNCLQCQEININSGLDDPRAIYAVIPNSTSSNDRCRPFDPNEYHYYQISPNKNHKEPVDTCHNSKEYKMDEAASASETIYEDSKLLSHTVSFSKPNSSEKCKVKSWRNKCSGLMCSSNTQTDSSEKIEKLQEIDGAVDDELFSTYQKFDGVCPFELSADLEAETNVLESSQQKNENALAKVEIPSSPVLMDDKKKRELEKKEFDDLLYISRAEMDNLLRIDNRTEDQNILKCTKPIKDLIIHRDVKTFDRVVSPNRQSSIRLRELGNSTLYKKRQLKRKNSLAKQLSLPNIVSKKKTLQDFRLILASNDSINQKPEIGILLPARISNSPVETSRRHSSVVSPLGQYRCGRKPDRSSRLIIQSSLPSSPRNYSPSGSRTQSPNLARHKTFTAADKVTEEDEPKPIVLQSVIEQRPNSDLQEVPQTPLKSILRNNKPDYKTAVQVIQEE